MADKLDLHYPFLADPGAIHFRMKTDVPFLREHKGITMDTSTLRTMLETARKDPHAELEVKVLAGMIQTPDVANRIRKAIRARAVGEVRDTH